jgi:hypothetical protein
MWLGREGEAARADPSQPEELGVLLDGVRIVSVAGQTRAANQVTEPPLATADRIPGWLGGGFLFRSRTAIYRSETFDGALSPLVSFSAEISAVSFGPKSALVRAADGERWAIELPSGARTALSPVGAVDIAALADGRAVAFTEGAQAFVSVDRAEHWVDITSQLNGRPTTVFALDESLWLTQSTGPAFYMDKAKRLLKVDAAPPSKPSEPGRDPRWRSDEPILRRVIRCGAPVDDATALVAVEGDIIKVALATGTILSVTAGHLPPNADCEAMRTSEDILLACTGAPNFVVSHLLGDKAPFIEQTFSAPGHFFASDDGALAYGAPCTRPTASMRAACVRGAAGGWQEYDLDAAGPDGGASSSGEAGTKVWVPSVDVVRWVPRADGDAFGILAGGLGAVDGRTGEEHPWQLQALPPQARAGLADVSRTRDTSHTIDRYWTVAASGALRGWAGGTGVQIALDGAVTLSPFTFDRIAASGAYAFGLSKGGRTWQSTDHGMAWVEVMGPAAGRAPELSDLHSCSGVGCDLDTWYRIGWAATPPVAEPPHAVAPAPARLAQARLPELLCKPTGDPRTVSVARGARSPEDLGLGAMRLPVSDSDAYVRTIFDRHTTNPTHNQASSNGGSDYYTAMRALFYGRAAATGDGPTGNVLRIRRSVGFTAPFDPSGSIYKTSFGVSELVASGRSIGLTTLEVLGDDPTGILGMTPVSALDPAGAGDLAFFGTTGAVALLHAGTPPKVHAVMRRKRSDDSEPVSAVELGADEVAILELDPSGSGHVLKLGPAGSTDVFDVPGPPTAQLYPANPDALFLGPRNEVGLVRTASGGEPPSVLDPALLIVPGSPTVTLAPWSTLTGADDPTCKADAGGFRGIVQVVAPWVRLVGSEPAPEQDAPMVARVKWSKDRVCLEAIELRASDIASAGDTPLETWMIARFSSPATAGQIAIVPGTEVRHPMQCSLAPR